jgi:hypothetical protein
MPEAKRTVVITVKTDRGTNSDAARVLNDVLDMTRKISMAYASVGEVKVFVGRPARKD